MGILLRGVLSVRKDSPRGVLIRSQHCGVSDLGPLFEAAQGIRVQKAEGFGGPAGWWTKGLEGSLAGAQLGAQLPRQAQARSCWQGLELYCVLCSKALREGV